MHSDRIVRTVMGLWVAFVPPIAFAQSATTGAIAGVVRDATGAVLPGVTVEARSPALVGVATAVSDSAGGYRFRRASEVVH